MLNFFRKNSLSIVYGIIIAFVVTTFLGVVFYNQSFSDSTKTNQLLQDRKNAVAFIGSLPVSKRVYNLELRRIQSTLQKDMELTPQVIDYLQLQALSRSIESAMLLQAANDQKIKVSRSEINSALYSVMDQLNVDSKKQLKSKLRSVGGSYNSLLAELGEDIKVSKLRMAIINSVKVTESDKLHLNDAYNVRVLFIPNIESTDNVKTVDYDLYQKAVLIRSMISDSDTFSDQIEQFNQSASVKSSIEPKWVTIDKVSPTIARVLYSLNLKEISQPIQESMGYFIVELLDNKTVAKKDSISEDDLLKSWQQIIFFNHITKIQDKRKIKVVDPLLRAIKFKNEGRFDDAISAYHALISNDVSNPYPHYYIAQLYLQKGQIAKAKQELLKAEIKESLLDNIQIIPEIHLLLAQIYHQDGFEKKRDQQYDKVLGGSKDIKVLNYLKNIFNESKDKKRYAKVEILIKELNEKKNVDEEIKGADQLTLDEPLVLDK